MLPSDPAITPLIRLVMDRGAVFHPTGIRSPPNGDQGLRTVEELFNAQHGKGFRPINIM
jgi:hypothetical protein